MKRIVKTLILILAVAQASCLLNSSACYAQTAVSYYDTGEEFVGPFPSWKNVKTDYGAKGDGVANDTAAIQKALDEMKGVQKNEWCVLYFPAGTYRIDKTLATLRKEHNDYLGSNLIGEDPATTVILWDGPADQPMLRYDSWYCKVSRLAFDGKQKASGGIVRAGGFSTYCEMSDLVFKDIKGIALNLGNAEAQGAAEHAILRCKFIRCGEGISTINWNSLDIYIWYCLFEDCGKGIYNRMGGYQVYENVFLRSKEVDIGSMNGMCFAAVNNTSIGSKIFCQAAGDDSYLRGNKIYNTTGPVAIDAGGHLVLLDNIFRSAPGTTGAVVYCANSTLSVGNTFTVAGFPLRPKIEQHPNAGIALQQQLAKAIDKNPATEFADGGCNDPNNSPHPIFPGTLQWNGPEGVQKTVVKYTITSGSDPKADPRDFQFLGSNNPGGDWTVLNTQKNLNWTGRQEKKEFALITPRAYSVYCLIVTANASGTHGLRLAEIEFLDEKGHDISDEKGSMMTGRNERWGQFYSLEQKIADPEKVPMPAEVRLPGTPKNHNRKVFDMKKGTGDNAGELQAQINAAAKEPAGGKPMVHVPKGNFSLKQTVTVPALTEIQIIGDGVGNGTNINWNGGGSGPVFLLQGPSRATLRDLNISGGGKGGVDAVVVEKADQEGGKVFANQLKASGAGGNSRCGVAIHVDGLDFTDVTMICGGIDNFLSGVKVRGGPKLAAGGTTPNQVVFLTGGTGSGCRVLDVTDGGKLVGEAFWYEADWEYPAALLDLPAASSGKLSVAAANWHMNPKPGLPPMVSINGFNGICTIAGSLLNDYRKKDVVRLKGDGGKTTILSACNSFQDAPADWQSTWGDQTTPAAQAAVLGSLNVNVVNKAVNTPAAPFVLRCLEQLRAVRITPPQNQPEGVTDVKLFRVELCGGDNKDAIRIDRDNR